MGERTSYENGTFNWVELATPDPDGARDFYTGLFGWDSESRPGGHGERLVFSKDGKRVSALDKMGERQPVPAWLSYIAVDDLDATASQATGLGASILMGPFEAGSGRAHGRDRRSDRRRRRAVGGRRRDRRRAGERPGGRSA